MNSRDENPGGSRSRLRRPHRFPHALPTRIVFKGAEATLEDLGSKNGTHVNTHRVTQPVALKGGDHIQVVSVAMTCRASDICFHPPSHDVCDGSCNSLESYRSRGSGAWVDAVALRSAVGGGDGRL